MEADVRKGVAVTVVVAVRRAVVHREHLKVGVEAGEACCTDTG